MSSRPLHTSREIADAYRPVAEQLSNRCANPRHPDGAWHVATPLPLFPGMLAVFTRRGRILRREVRAFDRRRRLWGCGCMASGQVA